MYLSNFLCAEFGRFKFGGEVIYSDVHVASIMIELWLALSELLSWLFLVSLFLLKQERLLKNNINKLLDKVINYST